MSPDALLLLTGGASCGRDETMRKIGLAVIAAGSLAAAGCATYPNQYGYDPYYNNGYNNGYYGQPGYTYDSQGRRVATGAAVGGAAGAVDGAILGGVLGATVHGRQYYRDTRGYCYYVDQYGQPHYSYDVRC